MDRRLRVRRVHLRDRVDPQLNLIDARLRQLHTWWATLCENGALPQWHDHYLEDLKSLRDALHCHVVAGDGAKYRVHFAGTGLISSLGEDPTGRWFWPNHEGSPPLAPTAVRVCQLLKLTYQTRAPIRSCSKSSHAMSSGRYRGESLWLPFSQMGHAVDFVLAATILTQADSKLVSAA